MMPRQVSILLFLVLIKPLLSDIKFKELTFELSLLFHEVYCQVLKSLPLNFPYVRKCLVFLAGFCILASDVDN